MSASECECECACRFQVHNRRSLCHLVLWWLIGKLKGMKGKERLWRNIYLLSMKHLFQIGLIIHICHHFRFSIVFTSSFANDAKSSAPFRKSSVRLLSLYKTSTTQSATWIFTCVCEMKASDMGNKVTHNAETHANTWMKWGPDFPSLANLLKMFVFSF